MPREDLPAMTTHTVLGRPTRILDVGPVDGPVVLCSSGVASMLSDWAPLAEMLRHDMRVIAFDRPGHSPGDEVPTGRLDLHEEASRLLSVLSACGVTQPAVVVGHSFGAAIAEATARLHPERVSHLVLLDGSVVEHLETTFEAVRPAPDVPSMRESGTRFGGRLSRWLLDTGRHWALSAARSRPVRLTWRALGPVAFAVGAPSRLRHRSTRQGLATQAGSPTMPAAVLRELLGYSPAMTQLLALRTSAPLRRSTEVLVVAANGWLPRAEPTAWVRSLLRQAETLEAEAPLTPVVVPHSGHLVMLDQPRRVAELIADAAP